MSVIYDALKKLRRQQDGAPAAAAVGAPKKRPGVLERNRVRVSPAGIAMVGGLLAVVGILGNEWMQMEKGRERALAMAREQMARQAAMQKAVTPSGDDTFVPPDEGMGTIAPDIPPPMVVDAPGAEPVGQGQPLQMATPEFQPPMEEAPPQEQSAADAPTKARPAKSASGKGKTAAPEPSAEDIISQFQVERVRTVTRLNQAQTRGDTARIEEELDNLESLLGGDDLYVLKSRAFHHLMLKDHARAEPLLRQVIARTPNDVEVIVNLAAAEQGLGRNDEAHARLTDALARFPNHPALQPYRR